MLDIGAWDGWFSFEMERRGARVLAIDAAEHARFRVAHELLGSRVEYHIADICRLSPKDLGRFDIVLFFGVLYHLKHPLLALETVCDLTTGMAFVESYVSDDGSAPSAPPVMEFYETTELRGQFDNWTGPNTACLLAFCRTAGFARVDLESVVDHRAHVSCFRHWSSRPGDGAAPLVTSVENSISRDQGFSSLADDYVSFWFKTTEDTLTVDDVFPEIGGYASRPVHLQSTGGDGWHANCKLPPGLDPGWHDARIRVRGSAFSNPVRIPVDLPPELRRTPAATQPPADLRIRLVTDGRTWERGRVHTGVDACLSLWATGLPAGCEPGDVQIRLGGCDLPAAFVSLPDAESQRQVNVLLPDSLATGGTAVVLLCGGAASPPFEIELV